MKAGKSEVEAERLLIERSRRGSHEALADLVQLHSARIYNWSFRILKNHEDAEDNTQNVLCKLCLNIKSFKGHSRLSTWLFRMTMNEALMERRRSRARLPKFDGSRVKNEPDFLLENETRDWRPDPEQQYIAKQLVAKAFRCLQPSSTQLFIQHKAVGWTQREIAERTGLTVSALKARIFWARERMLATLRRTW